MRRNMTIFSQYSTFIHFMPTFLWGRICYGQDYPGGSVVKNLPAIQEPQETMFSPWFGKIPWRTWQPTPVFLPGEFHGQSIRVGCIELNTTNTHTCYGQNWDLRHGASVCMSCVPTCNVCMLVCVCKNVFIWIVIGLVLNINFELILHLICIYIMFLLISLFYFSEDPQGKNGKISENLSLTDCSHMIDFFSPWDSHALNLYTFPCFVLFLCLYLSLPNF